MSKQKVNCAKGTREADLGHAVLSASGSHRWLNCTPSARLELEFENTTSEAAREGTAAHALCEHKLKKFLKKRSKRPVSDYNSDEMEECTDAYAEFVMEQYEEAKKSCKDPVILIEQKLDFSCYVPEGFGTGDCIIISDDKLHIIDFKYGQGIFVEAEHNPQMMLYALGTLEIYDALYDIKEVSMTIFQPRRENVSTWTIPIEELKVWAEEELKPKAQMSVTAQTYEELFSVIAVLKKQWNNFNSDVYFKNENVKMIYSLLYARPEVRNINIGYEHSEYHNSDYPQNEKGYEQFEKNIKNKVYVLELWDSKCTPLTQSIVKRFKNRSSLHPLN